MTPESILEYPHGEAPDAGKTLEVAPGIFWLRMPLPFALNHINLWLLEDGEGWAMVDCGLGNETTRAIWEAHFSGRLAGRPVKRVIATHHHPDHSGNAGWLTSRFGVHLWMAQAEYLTAHAIRDLGAGFSPQNIIAMFRRNGLTDERLESQSGRGGRFRSVVPEFPTTYRRLTDALVLSIGGRDWRVIMGYGHSPEHAALYCKELGVLISGDMVLPRISTNVSVWPLEPLGNPLRLFLESILRYAQLPARTLVLPSHGLPFRGLRERVAQLHEHHSLRLEELAEACATPRSAAEVIGTLFRRELDVHQLYFAMGEAMAHLHYLHELGQLSRETGGDGVIRYASVLSGPMISGELEE